MLTLIILNVIFSILIVVLVLTLKSAMSKSLFLDYSIVYFLLIIILPLLLVIFNFIYIYLNEGLNNLYNSFFPLIIPIASIIYQKFLDAKNVITYKKSMYIRQLVMSLTTDNMSIEEEDIRIRVLPGNRVDIIINNYDSRTSEQMKIVLEDVKNNINDNENFKNIDFKYYIDQKKNKFPILT